MSAIGSQAAAVNTRTPASELARLRERYGASWRIDCQAGHFQQASAGPGWGAPDLFVAVNRSSGHTLTDDSAGGLESKILAANPSPGPAPGRRQS
jgi:hypothetical protein